MEVAMEDVLDGIISAISQRRKGHVVIVGDFPLRRTEVTVCRPDKMACLPEDVIESLPRT